MIIQDVDGLLAPTRGVPYLHTKARFQEVSRSITWPGHGTQQ